MKRLEAVLQPSEAGPFEEADFAKHPTLVKGYIGPPRPGGERRRPASASSSTRGSSTAPDGSPGPTSRAGTSTTWSPAATSRRTASSTSPRCGTATTCPSCGGALVLARGIEIGHIFQLGRKYADALGLKVLDEKGELVTVTMGSYGIGVSRAVAAIAEQSHDDKGLIWPREIAPADIHLDRDGQVRRAVRGGRGAGSRSSTAPAYGCCYDDRRGVSPGVKFNDSELLGHPDHRGRRQAAGRGLRRGEGPPHRRARGRARGDRSSSGSGRSWEADVGVRGVIFDWGGTLTPWHDVDLYAQWYAYSEVYDPENAAALARRLHDGEERRWRRQRETNGAVARGCARPAVPRRGHRHQRSTSPPRAGQLPRLLGTAHLRRPGRQGRAGGAEAPRLQGRRAEQHHVDREPITPRSSRATTSTCTSTRRCTRARSPSPSRMRMRSG